MGALVKALSLSGEELFRAYFTVSLYFFPVLALVALVFRHASVHERTKIPLAGVTMPGPIGLIDARQRFAANGLQMMKEAYFKARRDFSTHP